MEKEEKTQEFRRLRTDLQTINDALESKIRPWVNSRDQTFVNQSALMK